MPLINNKEGLRGNVVFFANPLVELIASLHVIANPYHHDNAVEWSLRAHQKLPAALRKDIADFASRFNQWLFILDMAAGVAATEEDSYEDAIRRIAEMPELDFIYSFFGGLVNKKTLQIWIERGGPVTKEGNEKLLASINQDNATAVVVDPGGMRARMLGIIAMYWKTFFQGEWNRLRHVLRRDVEEQKIIFSRLDASNYVAALMKSRLAEDPQAAEGIKGGLTSGLERVVILPSVFIPPHQMFTLGEGTLYIFLGIDYYVASEYYDAESDTPPKLLLDTLAALGDGTRLRIVKYLSKSERTTKDLSEMLEFSAATVSQHLRILREARVVKSRKVKNFVYYSLIQGSIEDTYRMLSIYMKS